MYTLYTDKSEDFKCNIEVEGAKLNDTKARLVLETKTHSISFEGKINSKGECVVPITKLKNILEEGEKGKVKLEVIAEDTFFVPWENDYIVKTDKKVTVEVTQSDLPSLNENKKKKVTVKTLINEPSTASKISTLLESRNIHKSKLTESKIKRFVEGYLKVHKIQEDSNSVIQDFNNLINAKN